MANVYCVFVQKCLRTNLTVFQKLFAPSQTTYISGNILNIKLISNALKDF